MFWTQGTGQLGEDITDTILKYVHSQRMIKYLKICLNQIFNLLYLLNKIPIYLADKNTANDLEHNNTSFLSYQ